MLETHTPVTVASSTFYSLYCVVPVVFCSIHFLSFFHSFIPFSFSVSRRSARRVMRVLSALQRDLNDIRSKWDGRLGRFMRSSAFHLFIERRWHQGGGAPPTPFVRPTRFVYTFPLSLISLSFLLIYFSFSCPLMRSRLRSLSPGSSASSDHFQSNSKWRVGVDSFSWPAFLLLLIRLARASCLLVCCRIVSHCC